MADIYIIYMNFQKFIIENKIFTIILLCLIFDLFYYAEILKINHICYRIPCIYKYKKYKKK